VLATCMWLVDVHRVKWWAWPFVIFGVNPIVAFVASGILTRLTSSVLTLSAGGKDVPLQTAFYGAAFSSWLEPRDASLAFAIFYVSVCLAGLWLLHRKNIVIRI